MNSNTTNILEQLSVDLDGIADDKIKETILSLFNIIEQLSLANRELQQENQRLQDEVNRLKGEQGKPNIKPDKKNEDISSEKERKKHKPESKPKRQKKKDQIKIDRAQLCAVSKDQLPPDAIFKGYENVVVQDLKIETDNVQFIKEVYYSPSQKKTYIAKLPPGYEGEFGPTVKTLAIIMKNVCNMSEPKILDFFHNFDIRISAGTLSNFLIKNKEQFHQEKEDLFKAGLESTNYQQIDDTKARVNGTNHHTHIVCNPFYTAYFTTEKKNRLTVLEILNNGRELKYCLNQQAVTLLEQFQVSSKWINKLKQLKSDKDFQKNELEELLSHHLPALKERVKARIFDPERSGIAFYNKPSGDRDEQAQPLPIVKIFICDDAPQFKLLTEELGLCWIHEGRHYKKLRPVVPYYARKSDEFIKQFWQYYRKLLDYKSAPSQECAELLSTEFDQLFSTQTGYQQLDERIAKTREKKENLLLVLKYPELPLHNNESELAARAQVRKRDVSLHTMTAEGTKANDTFLSIVETCKKLGVNVYDYIFDRMKKTCKLPSLAQIIKAKSIDYDPAVSA